MKQHKTLSVIATAVLAFPLLTFAQTSNMQNSPTSQGMHSQNNGMHKGKMEAERMVPAQASLTKRIDAKDMHPGYMFKAKLSKDLTLSNGVKLQDGDTLIGRVEKDDMQEQGMSKLALRFTKVETQSGKVIPIKATIVGVVKPGTVNINGYPETGGNQVPNSWNDGTLQVDQIGVMDGVDLHSKIKSKNSGVFVSKTNDNVTLNPGSEIELAIAPRMHSHMNNSQMNNGGGMSGGQQ